MIISTNAGFWVGTTESVILPFSIHSVIYDGVLGDLKIKAFVETIKSNVKGKIVILLCEGSHLNVISLKYNNRIDDALKQCQIDSKNLFEQFENVFNGCDVVSWDNYIKNNNNYKKNQKEIWQYYSG